MAQSVNIYLLLENIFLVYLKGGVTVWQSWAWVSWERGKLWYLTITGEQTLLDPLQL